ncbi:hypothetical protein ACRAQ7_09755 [Erythrobacter sp. W53]|uniref:hypothetical protein n=1 Tax=Erythrobacter sp. W53 TaxID=3425947 RepID=UPI003D7669F3
MSRVKPLLAGSAAAAIVAGSAAMLFPPFGETRSLARADHAQFARVQSAFAGILAEHSSDMSVLEDLGFQADRLTNAPGTKVIAEKAGSCAGQGVYWLREDAGAGLAITAPHRGSDRHTGSLAATLFLETGAKAAAWNSAPRRPTKQCDAALDLAKEKNHVFSAFTTSFAEFAQDSLIVQLHGFDGDRRKSLAAQEAGMILSNGTERPSEKLLDLADCLSIAFNPERVLVYPVGTRELGALQNAQGQLLREAGFDGFVHMEISADLRAELIEDGALRGKLAACLVEAAK